MLIRCCDTFPYIPLDSWTNAGDMANVVSGMKPIHQPERPSGEASTKSLTGMP